jgi:hypothetical protein
MFRLSLSSCYYKNTISSEDLSKYKLSSFFINKKDRTFFAWYFKAIAAKIRRTVYLLIPPNVSIKKVKPG